jgi:hypothetical protein
MIQRARYDSRAAGLWSQFQEENPNKSFTFFQRNNPEFKELQKNYVQTLNDMREKNADTLRSNKKAPASQAPAAPAPASTAATPLPSTDPSVPSTHIRDPKTGVIRKKREGE